METQSYETMFVTLSMPLLFTKYLQFDLIDLIKIVAVCSLHSLQLITMCIYCKLSNLTKKHCSTQINSDCKISIFY